MDVEYRLMSFRPSRGLRLLLIALLTHAILACPGLAEEFPLELVNSLDRAASARYPAGGPRGEMNSYSIIQRNGAYFGCTHQGKRQSGDWMYAVWRYDGRDWVWLRQIHATAVDEHLETGPKARFRMAFAGLGLNTDEQVQLTMMLHNFPRVQINHYKWPPWKTEMLRALRRAVVGRHPDRESRPISARLVAQPWLAAVPDYGGEGYEVWRWDGRIWGYGFHAPGTRNDITGEPEEEELEAWRSSGLSEELRVRLAESKDWPSLPDW